MLRLQTLKDGRRAIIVRTSDRIQFKKCRRQWSWSSHLKSNLGSKNLASALWFGSAIHYALEDFHGHKYFERAADAFQAYCIATSKQHIRELPWDASELLALGVKMMDYYEDTWLAHRRADETYWEEVGGVRIPQTEVNFEIPIPVDQHPVLAAYTAAHGADCVLYRGTLDRVAIDSFGRLWVVEYKTAKRAEHLHYQTDPQVTTYVWAASHIYNRPIAGVVYQQFVKDVPSPPRLLSSGLYSTAQNQNTSAALYERALIKMYGAQERAPDSNRRYLTELMLKEDENTDRYVQRVYIERNQHMCAMESQKILLELEDMLNPDLPLYPNPTRDCSRMCSFLGACVNFDDGGDWQGTLDAGFSQRDQDIDRLWTSRIPTAQALARIRGERRGLPDLEDMQERLKALPAPEQAKIEAGKQGIDFRFNDPDSFTWDM